MRFAAMVDLGLCTLAAYAQPQSESANPVLLEAPAPTYPRSHFSNPNRTVLVGLKVSEEGSPESVHVVRSGGDRFDRNAVETVRQYRFKPASRDGKAVAQEIQVEVNYKVK